MPSTRNFVRVLHHMQQTGGQHSAYGLQQALGIKAGTVLYILRELEDMGLATSEYEPENALDSSKPPRQLYTLTEKGRHATQPDQRLPGIPLLTF